MNDFHLCTLESAWSGLVSMSAGPGPLKGDTFGEISCMQVIPFQCVFISTWALLVDDVKQFVSSLTIIGI